MAKQSIIKDKSYRFALRIIKLYDFLRANKDFVLAQQILKSGTSIGANVEESLGGQSRKDFISKLSIAYKEARETVYWLNLMKDSEKLDPKLADSLIADCEELAKIIVSIKLTSLGKLTRNS